MKPLIQSEAAECGLACLAMVAGHYGLHMDLPQMRRRFPLSLKGLRLNQLIEHAQQLGLNARALRLEMQDLGQLKLPCILHWDLNHFVVLARVGRKKAVLLDPGAAGDGFAGGFAPLHGRGAGACACAAVQTAGGKREPAKEGQNHFDLLRRRRPAEAESGLHIAGIVPVLFGLLPAHVLVQPR